MGSKEKARLVWWVKLAWSMACLLELLCCSRGKKQLAVWCVGNGKAEHGLHGCCAGRRVVPGAGKKEKRGQQVSSGSWQVHCAGMVRFWPEAIFGASWPCEEAKRKGHWAREMRQTRAWGEETGLGLWSCAKTWNSRPVRGWACASWAEFWALDLVQKNGHLVRIGLGPKAQSK